MPSFGSDSQAAGDAVSKRAGNPRGDKTKRRADKDSKTSKDKNKGKNKKPKGGLTKSGGDALQLTIDYVKQETLGPLRNLSRFIVAGVVGSTALAVGLVLLLLAGLRALQTETGTTFKDHLSWLPYVIVIVAALMVAGLAGWRIVSGPARRKLPHDENEHMGGPGQ